MVFFSVNLFVFVYENDLLLDNKLYHMKYILLLHTRGILTL